MPDINDDIVAKPIETTVLVNFYTWLTSSANLEDMFPGAFCGKSKNPICILSNFSKRIILSLQPKLSAI